MKTQSILLCTLGASWAVIPEVFALLDPQRLPLYRHHPRQSELEQLRHTYQLQPPDELWVCTTQGQKSEASLHTLRQWWQQLDATVGAPLLRIWQAAGTDQLDNQQEVEQFRELVYRLTLLASEQCQTGQLTLSLAGGRKTMSADLQKAASLFGCHALLHVVDSGTMPDCLRGQSIPPFLNPLPLEADLTDFRSGSVRAVACVGSIMPLIVGRERRSELLDVANDGGYPCPIQASAFPVELPLNPMLTQLFQPPQSSLVAEIHDREQQGQRLLGNYLQSVSLDEQHENWRMLYRLPPRQIEQLRTTLVGSTGYGEAWLDQLPKADIHRHLGGSLDLAAQQQVAQAVWEAMSPSERHYAEQRMAPLLQNTIWGWNWSALLKPRPQQGEQSIHRSHFAATLLCQTDRSILQQNLYGVTEPRIGQQAWRTVFRV